MRTTRLTLIVAAALGAAAQAGPADEPQGDLAKLQGTWTTAVGPNKDIPLTMALKGDVAEITVKRPDGDDFHLKGKIKLDDKASPKTLDWVGFTGPQGDPIPANLAIYKLEGDTWTVCGGGPGNDRPAKFEAGEGGPPMLNIWTRVKDKDKPAEKPVAGDLAKFQGDWTAQAGPEGDVAVSLTIKINAVTARWARGDGTELLLRGQMRINEQADPKSVDFFDFKRSDGEDTKDNLGIYAFDGEKLRICVGGPGNERPAEFKAGDGAPPNLFTFSRKKG